MKKILAGLAACAMLALFGCGGGGGSTSSTVSGTASQGAALVAGTQVTLTDAKGVKKTATVGANGSYSIIVDGLTAPFILNAGTYYSFASTPGTTNINPLTNLCMQAALGTSTVSTSVPTNFTAAFTTVVSDLKSKIDALFPATVSTTQKDFLNGNIVIGSGVDHIFDSITITAPDASGNFSITVSGQQIITGASISGTVTITPNASAITSANNTLYPTVFSAAMLSGKTFVASNGNITTLNTDGTVTIIGPSVVATTGRTWAVTSSGQLILTNTGNGTETVTITAYNTITGIITVHISNSDGTTNTSTITPAIPFTTSMFSGKKFTISNGNTITFNADGTVTLVGSNVAATTGRTWSITASGKLILTNTGNGTQTVVLTAYNAANGVMTGYSYNSDGTTNTSTLTPASVFTASIFAGTLRL